MKLTEAQISSLFSFTKKKWVHWYDLQVELVDHLASRIEEEMAADNKLTFEKALKKVYAEFGLFGFAKIVQQAEKALRIKNNKIWLQSIAQQFTWPNLLRSIFILMLFIVSGYFIGMRIVTFAVFLANCIFNFVQIYQLRRKQKKCSNLLLTQHASSFNISYFAMQVYFFPNVFSTVTISFLSPAFLFMVTLCFSVTIISLASKVVISKIFAEAEQLYPEVFVASNSNS